MSREIFRIGENQSAKELAIAKALKGLTAKIDDITEFNTKELRAISILQTDKIYKKMFTFYLVNKKHLKRQFAKELLKFYELSTKEGIDKKHLLDRILRRD